MSTFFKNYIFSLKEIRTQIDTDIKSADTEEMKINLQGFKNDLSHLIDIAYNNSAIEGKVSQLPEGVELKGWGIINKKEEGEENNG